jgi:hypothetical protein
MHFRTLQIFRIKAYLDLLSLLVSFRLIQVIKYLFQPQSHRT